MKNNLNKIILFIIIFMFVLTFFQAISFAGEKLDPDEYKTDLTYDDATYIFDKGARMLTVVRNIAAIISVITISIIGLRYMVGSAEQRAEYKQTMFPVVVGCILIGSLAVILTLIQSIV